MSERRFLIREIYEGEDPKSIHWITKSELKRRCLVMCVDYENYGTVKIDILLHGEKEV